LHAPQFAMSEPVLTSQPSSDAPEAGPLQSAKPALHVYVHVPPLHVRAAVCAVEHGWLQPPQWSVSVWRLASQPSSELPGLGPSQSAKPLAHVCVHCPFEQLRAESLTARHGVLQAPQFATSFSVAAAQPVCGSSSQSAKPPLQVTIAHFPSVQV